MNNLPPIHVVVLAGGAGTRFWPVSRRRRPKHLLTLGGDTTLLQATFSRVSELAPPENWWMVTGSGHADACRAAVPQISESQVLVEPVGRNTAPAVALAALHLAARDPEAVMVVLPADHHVRDVAAFVAALQSAARLAAHGVIVTLGVRPDYPETGFGYIERGDPEDRVDGAYRVARFREKPDLATAQQFVDAGTFYWNAGIFVMRPANLLAEVERQMPQTHDALQPVASAIGTSELGDLLRQAYEKVEAKSIDYGVMEGARDVGVVPVDCGWSDVGSWRALGTRIAPDEAGNVTWGRVVAVDSRDCIL
ncbi:MAG: mannose-1-phosphate guanylyltransferase, partial [Myxococcota bacterium]